MTFKPESLSHSMMEAKDLIMVCNPSGRIIFANQSMADALDYSHDELLEFELTDVIEELSRPLVLDLFQIGILRDGWHGELLMQRKDGSVFPTYVSSSPIYADSGDLDSILVIAHDISERKFYEEDIRKRAEIANSIVRSAPIGIITLDTGRFIKTINVALTQMLGTLPPNALVNQPFDRISGTFNPDMLRLVDDGLKGQEARIFNGPLSSDPLRDLTVSMISIPLRNPDGHVEGVCVLIENRTEMVRIEEQLLQADKLASTGFLAAGIAHEINNPLAGIRAIIEMLSGRVKRGGGDVEPYMRCVANIDRITEIIKRLLEYANPTHIQASSGDINQLIRQVMDFFKYHKLYRNVEIKWDLDADIPELVMDSKQIQQIFHNLAMNAAQAMKGESGILNIKTNYRKQSRENDAGWVEVIFRDTGPGIDGEYLRRIFDPFFTTKDPGEGTGLGLSVSHSIAKKHGGSLKARNHSGGGAEFILQLPVREMK